MSQNNQNPSTGTRRPTLPPLPPPEPLANGHHDSVEASLEDFINQANQALQEPAAAVPVEDPYVMNTGEVELIEDEELTTPAAVAEAVAVEAAPAEVEAAAPVEAAE